VDNSFDESLNSIFSNMVDICQEYVQNQAEKIFIHCYSEDDFISSNFFFKINNKVVDRMKINDYLAGKKSCDVSPEAQENVLNFINEEIIEMENLFGSSKRKVPAAVKLEFDSKTSEIKSNFLYDIHYTQSGENDISELFEKWFSETK